MLIAKRQHRRLLRIVVLGVQYSWFVPHDMAHLISMGGNVSPDTRLTHENERPPYTKLLTGHLYQATGPLLRRRILLDRERAILPVLPEPEHSLRSVR